VTPGSRRGTLALASLQGFVETYFTNEKGAPILLSAGQRFVCQRIEEGILGDGVEYSGGGVEMARGHGKSMLMKAMVMLAFLRARYLPERWGSRYAAILTAGTLYKQFSRDIAGIVTGIDAPLIRDSNGTPLLHQDFWIQSADKYPERSRKESQLWNIADRLIYIGGWDFRVRLSVRGMTGGRGDVRGLTDGVQRPDMMVVDDPMKEGESDNEEITANVKTFVKKSFVPCGSPEARLALFGTPFNDKDLITEACGNAKESPMRSEWPRLATCALPAVHPLTGALLCPRIWTPEKLAERRVLVGSRAFFCEYLLLPQGGGVRAFESEWITRWMGTPPPRQAPRIRRVMFLDPSLGRSATSDESAITVLDYDTTSGEFWIRLCDMARRRPQTIVQDYLKHWKEWRPDNGAVEDEGAQELLLPIFRAEIEAQKLPPEALPRLQATDASKVTRIKRLSPLVEFGKMRFDAAGQHKALRSQMTGWQGTDNEADDGMDSVEGAHRLVSEIPFEEQVQADYAFLLGR